MGLSREQHPTNCSALHRHTGNKFIKRLLTDLRTYAMLAKKSSMRGSMRVGFNGNLTVDVVAQSSKPMDVPLNLTGNKMFLSLLYVVTA